MRSQTVLIFEDSAVNAKAMSAVFKNFNHKVVWFKDPRIGLSALGDKLVKPDVIFMDYDMPGLKGPEVTREIRDQLKFKGRLILTTRNVKHDRLRDMFDAGCWEVADKKAAYQLENLSKTFGFPGKLGTFHLTVNLFSNRADLEFQSWCRAQQEKYEDEVKNGEREQTGVNFDTELEPFAVPAVA